MRSQDRRSHFLRAEAQAAGPLVGTSPSGSLVSVPRFVGWTLEVFCDMFFLVGRRFVGGMILLLVLYLVTCFMVACRWIRKSKALLEMK